jgi:uncharacterized RDD family membrane protein YckC
MDAKPEYAGFVTRAIAFVVDAAIVNAAAIIFAGAVALGLSVLPGSHDLRGLGVVLAGAAFVLWCVVYWSAFWSTTGQTPGDRVMRVRVQRVDGGRLHVGMAVVRVVATFLAALPLLAGFIPILLTARRRGFQDWVARTVVVSTGAPELAPAAGARSVAARRLGAQLPLEPAGRPLDNGAGYADESTIRGANGLRRDEDRQRAADGDGDLGLGKAPGDERAPV